MGDEPGVRPKLTLTAKPKGPPAPPAGAKMRADLLVVEKGLFRSRNRAQAETPWFSSSCSLCRPSHFAFAPVAMMIALAW